MMVVQMLVMMLMVVLDVVAPTVGHERRLVVMLDRVRSCRPADNAVASRFLLLLLLKEPSFDDSRSCWAGVAGWGRRPVIHSTLHFVNKTRALTILFSSSISFSSNSDLSSSMQNHRKRKLFQFNFWPSNSGPLRAKLFRWQLVTIPSPNI